MPGNAPRFPILRIDDHFEERACCQVSGEEYKVPPLVVRPNQHDFPYATPGDLATDPLKHGRTLPAVRSVGLRAGRRATIFLRRFFTKPQQVKHHDRLVAQQRLERFELVVFRVDAIGHVCVLHSLGMFWKSDVVRISCGLLVATQSY